MSLSKSNPEEQKPNLWKELMDKFDADREEVRKFREKYRDKCVAPLNPYVQFLEDHIFCIFDEILEKTILKAIETDSLMYEKSPFNAVDYIAELLWNMNPRFPKRKENWSYIFDMPWIQKILAENPRPYFPFSYLWSKEYAATLIQAFMRGYWVRKIEEVQEVRKFWKVWKMESEGLEIEPFPEVLLAYLPFYESHWEQDPMPPDPEPPQ